MTDNQNDSEHFNYNYPVVAFLYAWALIYLLASREIDDPAARMFPYIVIGLAVFFATLLLLKNILRIGEKEKCDFSGSGNASKILGLLVVYSIGVTYLGFYISTPVFLLLGMFILGQRNVKVMFLVAILVPLFAYVLFDLSLGLRVPTGEWF